MSCLLGLCCHDSLFKIPYGAFVMLVVRTIAAHHRILCTRRALSRYCLQVVLMRCCDVIAEHQTGGDPGSVPSDSAFRQRVRGALAHCAAPGKGHPPHGIPRSVPVVPLVITVYSSLGLSWLLGY